jgi:AcrR family transcriptional regulator
MSDVKRSVAGALSRKERATATRRRILDSALMAFTTDGYSSTTMDAVAADAGVAVQTVYFAFRTKGELLQAVYEHAVLGPEQAPPHQMPWWPRPDDGHDIAEAVSRFVARERYEHNEQLRRAGYSNLMEVLAAKHPLRPGMSLIQARDILLVLTGPQTYVQYTRDLGWDPGQLAAWTTTAILQQVFGI